MSRNRSRCKGSSLIEFAVSAFLLVMVLLSIVEFGRMLLVYNAVANAARAGVRYAIVHGGNRTGSGVNGPSGPGANPPEVVTWVQTIGGTGMLNSAQLTINVTYPDGSNGTGSRVNVQVTYPYDPLVAYFPVAVNLSSTSEGVIAF